MIISKKFENWIIGSFWQLRKSTQFNQIRLMMLLHHVTLVKAPFLFPSLIIVDTKLHTWTCNVFHRNRLSVLRFAFVLHVFHSELFKVLKLLLVRHVR